MPPQLQTQFDLTFVISVAGTAVALLALFFTAMQAFAAWYPIWEQRRNRQLLSDQFGLGPYDMGTIMNSTRDYIRPKWRL